MPFHLSSRFLCGREAVGVFTARCEVKWKSERSRLEKNVEKWNFFGGGFAGGFFDVIDMFARREDFGTKILSTF